MKEISSIIFPADDIFTVFDANNRSYWVNCITRIEFLSGEQQFYYLSLVIELLLLFGGIAALNGYVLLAWKHRVVHVNLLLILTNYVVVIQIGLYCRVALILYESRIIDISGLGYFPVPYLNIIRLAGFNLSFLFCGAVFSERICATRYVIDYERNVRTHISLILNVSADIFSVLIATLIVKGVLNGYYLSLMALFPNPFYCFLFRKMIRRNEHHLARLSEQRGAKARDDYTLSLRVQLKENIWSMQKIESVLYLLTFLLAFDLIFIFIPPLFLDRIEDRRNLQWFTVAANNVIALTVVTVCVIAAILMAFHSDFLPVALRRILFKKVEHSPSIKADNEAYFDRLSNQWNRAHQKQQFRF